MKSIVERLQAHWSGRSPVEIANRLAAPLYGSAGEWDLPKDIVPKVELIYLAVGIPDAATLPKELFLESAQRVLHKPGDLALRYGFGQGPAGLRDWLAARRSAQEGFEVNADWYQITNGSSGAIDLIVRCMIDPGDVIIAESPTYMGTLHNFRGVGADVRCVSVDEDGLDVEDLARLLGELKNQGKRVKLIYTISAYQNPTGVTLALARRLRLLELACDFNAMVLDDEAYRDLHFETPPPNALSALAEGWGVVTTGTFSKTVATGIRIGWIHARPEMLALFSRMRFAMGQNQLGLRLFMDFLDHGGFEPHLERVREMYRRKRDLLHRALVQEVSEFMDWKLPAGGFYFWITLNNGMRSEALWRTAVEEGVAVNLGSGFMPQEDVSSQCIRIAFAWTPEEQFVEAARRLRIACERVVRGDSA